MDSRMNRWPTTCRNETDQHTFYRSWQLLLLEKFVVVDKYSRHCLGSDTGRIRLLFRERDLELLLCLKAYPRL